MQVLSKHIVRDCQRNKMNDYVKNGSRKIATNDGTERRKKGNLRIK